MPSRYHPELRVDWYLEIVTVAHDSSSTPVTEDDFESPCVGQTVGSRFSIHELEQIYVQFKRNGKQIGRDEFQMVFACLSKTSDATLAALVFDMFCKQEKFVDEQSKTVQSLRVDWRMRECRVKPTLLLTSLTSLGPRLQENNIRLLGLCLLPLHHDEGLARRAPRVLLQTLR